MTKPPKQDQGSSGREQRAHLYPYSFHCRLLELVTPEKVLAGDAGDTVGLHPVKLLRGPLFSGFPVDLFSDISKNKTKTFDL